MEINSFKDTFLIQSYCGAATLQSVISGSLIKKEVGRTLEENIILLVGKYRALIVPVDFTLQTLIAAERKVAGLAGDLTGAFPV